ncbi:MAG: ABC transporter ATP-binding protein [Burkholderiaceae bacterium]|nr:ABC transporter ATP-binding protein [Burkholderiaceae bacterium]
MLVVEDLRAGYGNVEVLHGVSLHVDAGEAVAVLGPNGAGKSTLLRTISGLVAARGGGVRFEQRPLTGLPAHGIPLLGLLHVPEARHVFGQLSVEENLMVGGTPLPGRAERRAALEEIWALFPMLRDKAHAAAGSLSGGQQQMLAIGRALMARPRLVMLDEPSLGLAPVVVEELYLALGKLRQGGLTILLVEQDVQVALGFADRAYVLENGTIELEGAAGALQEDRHVREVYLGL